MILRSNGSSAEAQAQAKSRPATKDLWNIGCKLFSE